MKRAALSALALCVGALWPGPVSAVTDDVDRLIVEEGEEHSLDGEHEYRIEVRIDGMLRVEGSLHLIAPVITVNEDGAITADAAGHPGGTGGRAFREDGGHGGDGDGAGDRGSPSSNGNAGGGGGGAGSYGGQGERGGHGGDANDHGAQGGAGGAVSGTYGEEGGRAIQMGSGGGGGGATTSGNQCQNDGDPGGAGGGAIHLDASTVEIFGRVSANGGNGGDGQHAPDCWNHGSGGGGGASGGGILIEADGVAVEGTIQANGGNGGDGGNGDNSGAHGHRGAGGGGGGGGRIKLFALCREGVGVIEASGGGAGEGSNHDMANGNADGAEGSVHSEGDVEPDGCSGPPRIRLNGPYRGPEGSETHLTSEGTRDPDDGEFSVAWDLDDDGLFDDGDTADIDVLFPDDGTYPVCLRAVDDQGEVAEECTEVVLVNLNPRIQSEPPLEGREDDEWIYRVLADDAAGVNDPLTLRLIESPVGMEVDRMTVSWTPTPAQALVGRFRVVLAVEDDDGGRTPQEFHITVRWRDTDGDGMSDGWERQFGLNPNDPDDADEDPDGDGQSNLEEFLSGRDPTRFGRPDAPVIESPDDGGEVNSLRPVLTVRNAMDPDDDPLRYRFEIFADPALVRLVDSIEDRLEGEQRTSWQLISPLSENTLYHWRVRANDGALPSDYSEAYSFFVNSEESPPGQPENVAPANGAPVATDSPSLVVTSVTDVDRDLVMAHYQVLVVGEDPEVPGDLVAEVMDHPMVLEGDTRWSPGGLTEDETYRWRARAIDHTDLHSEWTEWWTFKINESNEAPAAATIVSPSERSQISELRTGLVFRAQPDPDRDPVHYVVELGTSPDFDEPERFRDEGVVEGGSGIHAVNSPGLTDNTEHFWRVKLSDTLLESDWVTSRFLVNEANDPPGAPELLSPADEVRTPKLDPELVCARAPDPDLYDGLRYRFEIAEDEDFTQLVAETTEPVAGTDDGAAWRPEPLEQGKLYHWRVQATDPLRETGPWSEVWSFTVDPGAAASSATPTPLFPINGEEVDVQPTLQAQSLPHETDQVITYGYEIASDSAFEDVVDSGDGVPPGAGRTYMRVSRELAEGSYHWHARATLNGQVGEWSESAEFRVVPGGNPADGGLSPGGGGKRSTGGLCSAAGPGGAAGPTGGPLWVLAILLPAIRRGATRG